MSTFRYQALEAGGAPVEGMIEAENRKTALQLLGKRGLFPSSLETALAEGAGERGRAMLGGAGLAGTARGDGWVARGRAMLGAPASGESAAAEAGSGGRIKRKDINAFTREMSALLGAAIPIPQALDGLGEQEENPALKAVVLRISEAVRKGGSFSASLDEHPQLFSKLYVSMVRVGEEAGALPKIMADLAELLEHEDEVRSEVVAAVSYPVFVLAFGVFTVTILLTVVMPRIMGMLKDMLPVLPLPTLVLLRLSSALHRYWLWLLVGGGGATAGLWKYFHTPQGAEIWDRTKLRLPVIGPVYRAAALSRFARTLGTLVKSGVSLLPSLKIVENTIGNRVLARQMAEVAEETRGGDSLAAPLRKLGIFPRTVVQMIDVGEETGRLDEMLLKVAEIEERHMRARTKTLISLLAPILILVVGALVGFMVIALLLPIFRMSRAVH